jgi:hypothetical protein
MASDENGKDRPYAVGYGKPPLATRFRKGCSGNPTGRPKRARGVRTLVAEALAQRVVIREGGKTSEVSKSEALVISLVTKALQGDMRATEQVLRLMQEQGEPPARSGGLTVHVIDRFGDPQ